MGEQSYDETSHYLSTKIAPPLGELHEVVRGNDLVKLFMKVKKTMQTIPNNVSRVTQLLVEHNYEAFLVGGCVRDMIMNRIPKDYDITTNATPEQIIAVFEPTGLRIVYENNFGTVSIIFEDEDLASNVREIQITPYRIEGSYSDHRHPDTVSFSETIHDDLSRRDFTINALAYTINPSVSYLDSSPNLGEPNPSVDNLLHEQRKVAPPTLGGDVRRTEGVFENIIDLYNGQIDIQQKIIRAVGDPETRFREDALRIMRAVRFATQLNFAVSRETLDAIVVTKHLLSEISVERIRDEFIKIIDSPNPGLGMFFMKQLGLLEYVLPEIIPSIDCEQGGVHIYDVFDHLVYACQHASDKGYSFHVKLSALFHDIGKPKTRRPGVKKAYTFYGHEVVGARIAKKIMERMKFPKHDSEQIEKFVRWHMFFSDTESITLSAVRRMIANVSVDDIWELMKVRECDRVGMKKTEAPYRLRKYFAMIEECLRDPISVKQLVIDGNYLMNELQVPAGRRMGWMLHALLQEVIEDPSNNTMQYLSNRVKQLEQLSDSELQVLGESGKEIKEQVDNAEVKMLHVKHGVHKKHM